MFPQPLRCAGASCRLHSFWTCLSGNSRQSARDAVAEATCHKQDRWMAAHINRAVLQPGFLHRAASANIASGNKSSSSSAGAHNGSKLAGSSPRHISHIHRGTVTPLPVVDKMRRYSSMNLWAHQEIIAQQSAGFKSVLKAGDFPLLVLNYLLKTPQDLRNNAGLSSFASKAAKGVNPGAKILPRLKMSDRKSVV